MAIWTDDLFTCAADLALVDSEIPGVASDSGVILDGYDGFIRRQMDESGQVVLQMMQVFGGWIGSSTLSANHIQAVLNIGGGAAASRVKVLLDQVVTSDRIPNKWSHLKTWVVYRTLVAFYRNVSGRVTEKDRFHSRLKDFTSELKRTQREIFEDLGLPVIYQPLPRPAAAFAINSGTWSQSNVTLTSGAGTVDAQYDVVITYACSQYYKNSLSLAARGNAESHPSTIQSVTLTPGNVLSVNLDGLVPSDGTQDPGTMALCIYTPLKADFWNIYAGLHGQTMFLQNSTPIPITATTYALAGDPVLSGPQPGLGQYADRRYQFARTNQRA